MNITSSDGRRKSMASEALRQKYRQDKVKSKLKYADECAYLQRRIDELQLCLKKVKRQNIGMLSWQDVSVALRDDMIEASLNQSTLSRRVTKQRAIAEALYQWVLRSNASNPINMPSSNKETWHHTTLMKGDGRLYGMRWIIQQMLVQTEKMFQTRTWDEDVKATVTSTENVDFEVQGQIVLPCNYVDMSNFLWHHNPTVHPETSRILEKTDDFIYILEDGSPSRTDVIGYVLYGRQISPERAVHVSRTIIWDEKHPLGDDQWTTPTLDWITFEPMGSHQTLMRIIIIAEQPSHPTKGRAPFTHFGVDTSHPSFILGFQKLVENRVRITRGKFETQALLL